MKFNRMIICLLLSSISGLIVAQTEFTRHQIGLNMGEFVPLFKTQASNFQLNYRFSLDTNYALRSALTFDKVKEEDGRLDLGIKIGADRRIKSGKKFIFYTGLDYIFTRQQFDVDGRSTNKHGIALFIGAMYRPAKSISISTEPGIYAYFNRFEDPANTGKPIQHWQEYRIDNIGQLLISFHF